MAQWQRNMKIGDLHTKFHEDKLTIQDLAKQVAARLGELPPFPLGDELNEERKEIVEEFIGLSEDQDADIMDYDVVLEKLYDWGDTALDDKFGGKKVCFVDAFSE